MLAVVIGTIAIVLGFLILLLPVFITELSRPRDSVWGAVTMVLGLILLTSHERFNGSPMLAVLLGALLCSRLVTEVSRYRWQQLSSEEQRNLRTFNRWGNSFKQFFAAFAKLGLIFLEIFKIFKPKAKPSSIGKKWIRKEIENKNPSLDSNQVSSLEANFQEKALVPDKILKTTSGNNPADAS